MSEVLTLTPKASLKKERIDLLGELVRVLMSRLLALDFIILNLSNIVNKHNSMNFT